MNAIVRVYIVISESPDSSQVGGGGVDNFRGISVCPTNISADGIRAGIISVLTASLNRQDLGTHCIPSDGDHADSLSQLRGSVQHPYWWHPC